MNTKTTETNGKHYATVSAGDRIVYRTPGYVTARMALADAKCWEAFNGEKEAMEHSIIKPGDTFKVRTGFTHEWKAVDYATMKSTLDRIAGSVVTATVRVAAGTGERYIDVHNGGSSYGQYFWTN